MKVMNVLGLLVLLLISFCLISCSLSSKISDDSAKQIVNNIIYIKDSHGICYAAINNMTYNGYFVISLTNVPCEKVGL